MAIHDARGRLVRELSRGRRAAGEHAIGWDSRDSRQRAVAAGTYFGRLEVRRNGAAEVQVRKLAVLR